jgi:diacylglycerol kinase family enzyme
MALNGGIESHNSFIAAVANGKYFGGGMKISPASDIQDGTLDIIIIQMVKRSKIPGMLLKFLKGRHLELPVTKTYKADSVTIKCLRNKFVNIDGELLDGLEFRAECVPGGFKMVLPRVLPHGSKK